MMNNKEELKNRLFEAHLEKQAWQPRFSYLSPIILFVYLVIALLLSKDIFAMAAVEPSGFLAIAYTIALSLLVGAITIITILPLWRLDSHFYEKRLATLREKFK